MRALYSAAWVAGAPLAAAYLLWRGRRQPEYRRHWRERWALGGGELPWALDDPRPLLWLHAVSVGETRAAQPLVAALLGRFPDHRLLVTQTTPTGRQAARELFGQDTRVGLHYLPYDGPAAPTRFLRRFRPALGLLMETEVWPNLSAACRRHDVPLVLVNARLSERSHRRMARAGRLLGDALGALAEVCAQTGDDARRLRALGAPEPVVTGNLKFDMTPDAGSQAAGHAWRAGWPHPRVLLGASLREGEEALLLDALSAHPDDGRLLVLVPRHPQRFDEVAALLASRGLRFVRRSLGGQEAVSAGTQVLLGDSMGEMAAWYAASDLTCMGGTLLPFGGQNLIEACAGGTPVLLGPHTYNFDEASRQAVQVGAARRVADAPAMAREAATWLGDAAGLAQGRAAALDFAAAHRGATARTLGVLERFLESPRTA